MPISEAISISSALLLLVGYVLYYKKISSGDAQPNIASWLLFVVIIIINTASYGLMTGDWVKAYLTVTSLLAAIVILLNILKHGKFKWCIFDVIAFFAGIIAALMWWWFHSATYGNLILQVAIFVAFIPTLRSAWKEPRREPSLPWFVWSVSFVILLLVVFIRWQEQYQDLVYPTVGATLHALVGIFALRVRKMFPKTTTE